MRSPNFRQYFSVPDVVASNIDREYREVIGWFLFPVPKIVAMAAFLILPFLLAFWMSFHEWNPIAASKPFVGLDNYIMMFNDPVFRTAVLNNVVYGLGMVFVSIPISLGLAVLINVGLPGSRFVSASIFAPVVISWVIVSLIWKQIYHPQVGILNVMLRTIGLPTIEWLVGTDTSMLSITIVGIWKNVGFNMVVFLAGLQSIPEHLYEAAKIDGANRFQRFWYITLPQLKPTLFFVLVITIIGSFRLFTPVFVMTDGGPLASSHTIVYYFYDVAFKQFNMGYGSAMAVFLFAVVFGLSIVLQNRFGDQNEY